MDMTVHKDISGRSSLEVMDEIRQDGETVLSSSDGISIPMIFRNLSGKNLSGIKSHRSRKTGANVRTPTPWHGRQLVAEAKLGKKRLTDNGKTMEKEKLTVNDEDLIELAYSISYRSCIRIMIQEADTERCRVILRDIMNDASVDWED